MCEDSTEFEDSAIVEGGCGEDNSVDTGEALPNVKVKKTPVSKEDKKFLEFIKRYFSSVCARRAPCVYFNLFENKNKVLLCNTDGLLFANFNPSELSFHIVEFKTNFEYLERLKTILMVSDNKIEVRNVVAWLSWINKFGLDKVLVWQCPNTTGIIVSDLEGADQPYSNKQIVGKELTDFHVIAVLTKWIKYILSIEESFPNFIIETVDRTPKIEGCMLFEKIDLELFKQDTKPIYSGYNELYIVSFDGLSTPALKEFINKTQNESTYKRRIWAETPDYFRAMVRFEDENAIVESIRPYFGMYPIPKKPNN